MSVARSIVIAAALIAFAILADGLRAQSTTTAFSTAYVVATCGTPPTLSVGTGMSYTANSQAPLTMNTGGSLCVNQ
jgi:hypothetical protein